MQLAVVDGQKVFEVLRKFSFGMAVEIPQRMIEDEQYFGNSMQRAQQVAYVLGAWLRSAGRQLVRQLLGARGGKIVHAEMELRGLEGNRPFQ